MNFTKPKATVFETKKLFYNNELEIVLCKIYKCYEILVSKEKKLEDNENHIRDVLVVNYLRNTSILNAVDLQGYLFERESPEDYTKGRVDIKVITQNSLIDPQAYYSIECKRINAKNTLGKTGLNGEYVREGVNRYLTHKYSSHFNTNAMLAFITEQMDIEANTISLMSLMDALGDSNAQLINNLTLINKTITGSRMYFSKHLCGQNLETELKIYHLMLDFSMTIQ